MATTPPNTAHRHMPPRYLNASSSSSSTIVESKSHHASSTNLASSSSSSSPVTRSHAAALSQQQQTTTPLPVVAVSKVEKVAYQLLLTSLQPNVVPAATGALMNLMFFPNQSHRFFSYTHTQDELSLLLDVPTAAATFPPNTLTVGPGSWRILEIQEGSEIIDTPGIVSSLCAPLFEQRHVDEMLYLSTFVSDLILVREQHIDIAADVVGNNLEYLIESRRKVQEAMALAEEEERQAEQRRIQMEQEDMRRANEAGEDAETDESLEAESDAAAPTSSLGVPVPNRDDPPLPRSVASSLSSSTDIFQFSWKTTSTVPPPSIAQPIHTSKHVEARPISLPSTSEEARFSTPRLQPTQVGSVNQRMQQLSMEAEGSTDGDEGIAMHLSKLPFRLVLLTFDAKYLPQCMAGILHALLLPSSDSAPSTLAHFRPSFFSFTQAGSQVSLIVEASCLPRFPPHIVTPHKLVWNALQVSQGTESTDPAGLVAPLSSILAKVGVSIYYLSTYNLDYILVAEKEVQLALTTLSQSMNVMVDSSS